MRDEAFAALDRRHGRTLHELRNAEVEYDHFSIT